MTWYSFSELTSPLPLAVVGLVVLFIVLVVGVELPEKDGQT